MPDPQWVKSGLGQIARARRGQIEGLERDVSAWPDTWIAAELLTHGLGTVFDIDVGSVLDTPHVLQAQPVGDVVAELERARALTGRERLAALEAAWRACFAPELADAIEALDASLDAPVVPAAKKKKDAEAAWMTAAATFPPRSLFGAPWPAQWKDAQRRMRAVYARPRSPLWAAAAIEVMRRDPKPYTSLASQVFWQAFAWFVAEQADVRQLPALAALERAVAEFEGRKDTHASDALRAFQPRALPAKARDLLAKLAIPAAAKAPAKLSLASADERLVAADELLQRGDPRGELITIQTQLAAEVTPALVKRQAALIKKHAKAWVPPMIYRETCVFRGGVPVAGHLQARSDPELRTFVGSQALATFETLIVDDNALGKITAATMAAVAASLPALRHVITTDRAATAIAKGPPTPLVHVALERVKTVSLDGPGLPALSRFDAPALAPAWRKTAWFARIAAFGIEDADTWAALARETERPPAVVLIPPQHPLSRYTPSGETPWELWAERDGDAIHVTARHQVGSTANSLVATLARVPAWKGITTLRIPGNFVAAVPAPQVEIEAIDPVEPIRDGVSLALV